MGAFDSQKQESIHQEGIVAALGSKDHHAGPNALYWFGYCLHRYVQVSMYYLQYG